MPLVKARNLTHTYALDQRTIPVLKDVSLDIDTGEFVVVSGSSGSGKTTLLTLLSGLDRPTAGQVIIDGHDISKASEEQLAPFRNRFIGYVFQSFHLIPSMTALATSDTSARVGTGLLIMDSII